MLEHHEKLACRPGLVRIRPAAELCGFVVLSTVRGYWRASSGQRLPLAPDSVLSFSGEAALELSLETAAELLVVCMRRRHTLGRLHEQLFPRPALIRLATPADAERLRGLFALLGDTKLEGDSRATECLLEAYLWSVAEARQVGTRRAHPDAVVLRALSMLQENLARPLRVAHLARQVGLSRAAFARRFSAALGLPPERYHTWLRLRRAAQLLITTDTSLAGIAAQVGYSSEFAFSRAFRRWYGVSPGIYRRSPTRGAPRILALAA